MTQKSVTVRSLHLKVHNVFFNSLILKLFSTIEYLLVHVIINCINDYIDDFTDLTCDQWIKSMFTYNLALLGILIKLRNVPRFIPQYTVFTNLHVHVVKF